MGGRHRDAGHFGAWRATDDARGATENVYDQSSRICRATAWALPDVDEVFAQTGEVSVNHCTERCIFASERNSDAPKWYADVHKVLGI